MASEAAFLDGSSPVGSLRRFGAGCWLLVQQLLAALVALLLPHTVAVGGRRLRISRLIAEGGCGYVWLAHDGRATFALKQILSDAADGREAVRAEVATHRSCAHANLMPLIDVAYERRPDGKEMASLLFPLMEGGSAQDALARAAALAPPVQAFSEAAVLALGLGVARGLQALHGSGRAHRDVCPRNVMLRLPPPPRTSVAEPLYAALPVSDVVLTDFGSCAPAPVRVVTRADALRLQEEAQVRSSMPFRAPELWSCDPGCEVRGELTDAFALGCTLFACAFGLSPFESVRGDDGRLRCVEPSHNRVLGPVALPSAHSFSADLVALLLRMLEREPSRRASVAEAADELERLLAASRARRRGEAAVAVRVVVA